MPLLCGVCCAPLEALLLLLLHRSIVVTSEFDEQEKRYRSMQEHIRRAHPEHYISKLPATEESFQLMINTPPSERPPPPTSSNLAPHGLYNKQPYSILHIKLANDNQPTETTDTAIMVTTRAPLTLPEPWTTSNPARCCQPLALQQPSHSYTIINSR